VTTDGPVASRAICAESKKGGLETDTETFFFPKQHTRHSLPDKKSQICFKRLRRGRMRRRRRARRSRGVVYVR